MSSTSSLPGIYFRENCPDGHWTLVNPSRTGGNLISNECLTVEPFDHDIENDAADQGAVVEYSEDALVGVSLPSSMRTRSVMSWIHASKN